MDQDLKEVLLSFGGVTLGFALSEVATIIRSYRAVTREGKTFDFEISALKPALKKQVETLKIFSEEIKKHEETEPTIYVFNSLELFKAIDRSKINRYYQRKDKNTANDILRRKLNAVTVIDFEIERFLEYYNEYHTNLGNLLNNYRAIANKFMREISEFGLKMEKSGNPDSYARDILQLIETNLFAGVVTNIIPFKKSLHAILLDMDFKNSTHTLHNTITTFNQNGFDAIRDVEVATSDFLRSENTIFQTLKECYRNLYDENLE